MVDECTDERLVLFVQFLIPDDPLLERKDVSKEFLMFFTLAISSAYRPPGSGR